MGNDYEGQDSGIEILMNMPEPGVKYINHHLGNALGSAILFLAVDDIDGAKESLDHAVKDLRIAGLLQTRGKNKLLKTKNNKKTKIIYV